FEDREVGGFFYTAAGHEQLISRPKDVQDSSVPSGNSMAATLLLRLGKLSGRGEYLAAAERTLKAFASLLEKHPAAAGQMLIALDFYLGPTRELIVVGDAEPAAEIMRQIYRGYLPNRVLARRPGAGHSAALDGAFRGKTAIDGQPTLYVCQDFVCQQPVAGREPIRRALNDLA
ncbi:MAG TPA: thioredoxin domain-containing protein, partial [Pirellulales bacterium]